MKNLLFAIFLLLSISSFAQNPKQTLTRVSLENDSLKNYFKDGSVMFEGKVIGGASDPSFIYDPVFGSYFSIGSGIGRKGPGRWNIVIGEEAGDSLTNDANYNTFLGRDAGKNNSTGDDNFFAGWDAGYNNKSGNANIGLPQDALYSNIRGSNNIALGRGAQYSNIAGSHNISAGWQSLYYLTSGAENVALGGYAGAFLLKGSGNVYIGAYAGEHNDAAVGKTINDAIYIGHLTGISSAHSNSINIGYNIQSTVDGGINIGNVYYAENGKARVNTITISGKEIAFDDNYMYVVTSTGQKKVALQDVNAAPARVAPQQEVQQTRVPKGFILYDMNGQRLGKVVTAVPYY